MKIKKISLYNYRLYKDLSVIEFSNIPDKNIVLISGENGFGKTTFLHSLLWCLYGKLISDIELNIKKEIQNGGYSQLLKNNLNNSSRSELSNIPEDIIHSIKKNGYNTQNEWLKSVSQYFVSLEFCEVIIPSIPCSNITVKRGYDSIFDKEFVEILIDDMPNELTNEIGPDVFINDFILSKDIARFFFFDSEQIVMLAENNTPSERKRLGSAYNEVLGVRKYEDLKKNLDNVRVRFRKRSSDVEAQTKIEELTSKKSLLEEKIISINNEISRRDENLSSLRVQNDELQLQLAREGNHTTIDEIKKIREIIAITQQKDAEYKQLLNSFLEYAPFAICGKLFKNTMRQLDHDFLIHSSNSEFQTRNNFISDITSELFLMVHKVDIPETKRIEIQDKMQLLLSKYKVETPSEPALLSLTERDYKEFQSIYNYVISTYRAEFMRLADDYKKNRLILDRNSRRLSNIHQKEQDALIKELRSKKTEIENRLNDLNSEIRGLSEKLGTINQELNIVRKQLSELLKKVDLYDMDAQKDSVAADLCTTLTRFLASLKQEKKYSLERRIKVILNSLMHKDNFVHRVEVNIIDDDMDIELFGSENIPISKDSLSKGEQQLYATSILKALVEESGIEFPVFIDSPLQKFDKSHAAKIISEFYPTVSSQVILFPLLHKELTVEEYKQMLPLINATYLIKNNTITSCIEPVNPETLMVESYV